MRVTTNNARGDKGKKGKGKRGKKKGFWAEHNDRNFDTQVSHIDPKLSKNNVYWHCYQDIYKDMSFKDVELKFYTDNFSASLQAKNDSYMKQRHPERCQTIDDYMTNIASCPESTLLGVGKKDDCINIGLLKKLVEAQVKWHQEKFPNIKILNWSIHADEDGALHAHIRKVYVYKDKNGNLRVGQAKALEEMGIKNPQQILNEQRRKEGKDVSDKDKEKEKNTRFNNAKQTYTSLCREHFIGLCKEYGIENLELDPKEKSKSGLTLDEYKARQEQEKAERAKQKLEQANQELEQKQANLKALEIEREQKQADVERQKKECGVKLARYRGQEMSKIEAVLAEYKANKIAEIDADLERVKIEKQAKIDAEIAQYKADKQAEIDKASEIEETALEAIQSQKNAAMDVAADYEHKADQAKTRLDDIIGQLDRQKARLDDYIAKNDAVKLYLDEWEKKQQQTVQQQQAVEKKPASRVEDKTETLSQKEQLLRAPYVYLCRDNTDGKFIYYHAKNKGAVVYVVKDAEKLENAVAWIQNNDVNKNIFFIDHAQKEPDTLTDKAKEMQNQSHRSGGQKTFCMWTPPLNATEQRQGLTSIVQYAQQHKAVWDVLERYVMDKIALSQKVRHQAPDKTQHREIGKGQSR